MKQLPVYVSTLSQTVNITDLADIELKHPTTNLRLDHMFPYSDIIASTEIPIMVSAGDIDFVDVEENYGTFRLLMMSNAGWIRIKALGAPDVVAELIGAMAYMDRGLLALKSKWNELIGDLAVADEPTQSEIDSWVTITNTAKVNSTYIPDSEYQLNFDSNDGTLL